MTKNEFLEGLRKALGNDLDRETVQENVAYYDGYISVQVNIGRTEEEVTAELGDPWVIAQTIIDAEEAKRGTGRNAGSSYTTANSGFSDPVYGDGGDYTREDYYDQNQGYQTHVHTFGFDSWWEEASVSAWNYWDYRACSIDCWRNYKPSGTDFDSACDHYADYQTDWRKRPAMVSETGSHINMIYI